MRPTTSVKIGIFCGGDLYVGYCPALDVSSSGERNEEAERSVHEALRAFLEECEIMGTLDDVLAEAGLSLRDGAGPR
jgi:hypothetical protein